MNENKYKVTWVIELDANSENDAARKALDIQRDPESIATVFQVERYIDDVNGSEILDWPVTVDLLADSEMV